MKARLIALLLAASVATACGTDLGRVEQDLEAQAQAQTDLRQRLGDLEERLNSISGESGSGQQELRTVSQRLGDLEESLDQLSTLISEERAAREAADGAANDERATLDGRLDSLESEVASIQDAINTLRAAITALQQRMDNHESGHP